MQMKACGMRVGVRGEAWRRGQRFPQGDLCKNTTEIEWALGRSDVHTWYGCVTVCWECVWGEGHMGITPCKVLRAGKVLECARDGVARRDATPAC